MHDEMDMKLEPVCEMKHSLTELVRSQFEKGLECVNTDEAGKVVDMIKDLAETEEKCWKAEYYKAIVKAMDRAQMEEVMAMMDNCDYDDGRMGYNHNHYASGRFAPSGHGRRMGYIPEPWADREMPYVDSYLEGGMGRMGYNPQTARNSAQRDMRRRESDMMDGRHGRAYQEYQMARRHYTTSGDEGDRREMHEHAKEHVSDAVITIKEIWEDADPELRKRMKEDLGNLMNQMK